MTTSSKWWDIKMFTYAETEETIPPVEIVEENDLASTSWTLNSNI